MSGVSQEEIGAFVDSKAGKMRTPGTLAGRLLEEAVELALSAGLQGGEIMMHVADSLHNQALKASAAEGRTRFPSDLTDTGYRDRQAGAYSSAELQELGDECADVSLIAKDLCYVAGIDLAAREQDKWGRFIQKSFRVSPGGTLYAVKPHITGAA